MFDTAKMGELGSMYPAKNVTESITPTMYVETPGCAPGYNFLPLSRRIRPAGQVDEFAPAIGEANVPVVTFVYTFLDTVYEKKSLWNADAATYWRAACFDGLERMEDMVLITIHKIILPPALYLPSNRLLIGLLLHYV